MKELATSLENLWMAYNAALVSRLHPEVQKKQITNVVLNNMTDIIKAIRAYDPNAGMQTVDVITNEAGAEPRKARKKSD